MFSLVGLPLDALRQCVRFLRATDLAPGLGSCSTLLQRECRWPELWRQELEECFPVFLGQLSGLDHASRSLCWRSLLVKAFQIFWRVRRDELSNEEHCIRQRFQWLEADRREMLKRRSSAQQGIEDVQSQLCQLPEHASDAASALKQVITQREKIVRTNICTNSHFGQIDNRKKGIPRHMPR